MKGSQLSVVVVVVVVVVSYLSALDRLPAPGKSRPDLRLGRFGDGREREETFLVRILAKRQLEGS